MISKINIYINSNFNSNKFFITGIFLLSRFYMFMFFYLNNFLNTQIIAKNLL